MTDRLISQTQNNIVFMLFMTIVFAGLRLCSVIDWSWIWILSPVWIFPAAVVGIVFCGITFGVISAFVDLAFCCISRWRRGEH